MDDQYEDATDREVHIDALREPDPCGLGLTLLLEAVKRHASEEARSVAAYGRLAQQTQDFVVATLMRLLAEDEERHHRLFDQIGTRLYNQLNWVTPATNASGARWSHPGWLALVRGFEQDEQRGSGALRDLARRAQQQGDPLTGVLLDSMAMDSERHAHLLRFVGQRLNTRAVGRPRERRSELMLQTLVVPLDGSQLAECAVPYAIRLAQAAHGRLVLMQAVQDPDAAHTEHAQLDASIYAREYLDYMAESLAGQVPGVEVATAYGPPAETILETADAYQADGIIMATHGRTGFAHLLYGSVTEATLARSSVPVFVVYARPGEAPAPAFSPASARLLVPQDGSESDAPALRAAVEMLGPRGEIVLATVVAPAERVVADSSGRHVLAYVDQQEEARTREVRDYLNTVAEPLRHGSNPVNVRTEVRLGDPASGIAMAALDAQADLIVMATHGRTGLSRAVLGSVAGTVMRTATTPVVLVRARAQAVPEDAAIDEPESRGVGPVPTF
jgi:nucleotide-binding universal stress UspA family protein